MDNGGSTCCPPAQGLYIMVYTSVHEGSLPPPLNVRTDPDCWLCLWPKQQFSISTRFGVLGENTRDLFFSVLPHPSGWHQCSYWQRQWDLEECPASCEPKWSSDVMNVNKNTMFRCSHVHLAPGHLKGQFDQSLPGDKLAPIVVKDAGQTWQTQNVLWGSAGTAFQKLI